VPHSFPPVVEVLEFRCSPILISLLCGLKNYDIIDSALPIESLLIANLIEQGYLLVTRTPMIFKIFQRIGGAVVGVSYDTLELCSMVGVAFNVIHGMHQTSMNLKTYFASTTYNNQIKDNEMMKLRSTKFSSS
jgi:hypothetical protein